MEFLYIVAVLAAFVLGAWVRQPFTRREKEKKETKHTHTTVQDRLEVQKQNLLGFGIPGYKQKGLDDDED